MECSEPTQEAKNKLEKAIEEVNAARKAIFDKFDQAAGDAADILIGSMRASAKDQLDLGVKRLNKESAKDVLKLAGFDIERHEHRVPAGGDGFKVVIVDYGANRDNNPPAEKAAGV